MSDFPEEKVVPRVIEDEMKQSYLDYAMSVIVGRALPDARDGLKPVHRRILYAMNDLGMKHTGSFKKCARIVGEVLGKYHPHGDSAVYDSLVRMAQEWSLRYPLVFGQGNFGSTDGDNPAAMRYTEAKLQKISNEILEDIDKETVSFSENFDGSLKEPDVLPSKFANMLINGSSGIAVGMATNIAPHNLTEVAHAVIELINNPEAEVSDLMQHISGPDFPTSGRIMGRSEIMRAYKTGKGKIIVRGVLHREEVANRERVVITEIPYQVNKSALVEEIANLVKDKRVDGITDIRDESDRKGIRVVIECRKNANLDVLENQLFKMSRLQVTFGINTVALVEGEPKLLGLKEALEVFLKHRYGVVRARTAYDLKKAEARHHILLGLVKALNDIDRCVQLIKKAKSVTEAREALKKAYDLSDEQAQAILDMRLQKLTSLEQNKIREELEELEALIKELKSILDSDERIYGIIKQEQEDLIETYGDERRTKISDEELSGVEDEDLIESEDQVVTLSHAGYVKRLPIETYRTQKRGGKGVIGMTTKEEDFVEQLFIANTHDFLLAFTNNGRLHWLKTYKIPEAARQAKGKAIVNLLELPEGEKVKALIPVKEFVEGNFLVKCTKNGVIKKTSLAAYSNPRKGGIISMGLRDGDELVEVKLTKGNQEILIATKQGMAVRFQEGAVRAMGRSATGVRGIKLKKNDEVIGMIAASSESKILSITEKGYGKKSQVADYRLTNRGGSGVRNVKVTDKTGIVVVVKSVTDDDELILASENGIVIRTSSGEISTIGRNTQGVRVMRLGEGDKVVSVGVIRE